ncbi:MAG: adenylate/guanylate cyclase domain-containing protein [Nitrososphaerales archaeon]
MIEELNTKGRLSNTVQRTKNPSNLVYAHFLFVGMVGLSDASIPIKKQIKKIEALDRLLSSCETFRNTDHKSILRSPTEDGVSIAFLEGPILPLRLAIELHKKLKIYNRGKSQEEKLGVRIGLNDGPVYVAKDLQGNPNLWGPGIILAKRVMDIGNDGHILLTPRLAETLRELSDEYKVLIKPLHDYTIKHGQTLLLYSLYGNGIGNPKIPRTSLRQRSKIREELMLRKLSTKYTEIEITLTITNPQTLLTHHRRFHNIQCIADDPLNGVLQGIATDVPKSFNDLNIRMTDESGRELKIISINFDKPYQKEFTVSFNRTITKGENCCYTLEYDVEEPERYFENYFSSNCGKYTMSLVYPSDARFKPVVYHVNVENETQTRSKSQVIVTKMRDNLVRATWTETDVLESQAFRLEW